MDRYLAANKALWNEWTAIHVRSAFYDVEGWKAGDGTAGLRRFVREEVGDVAGKDLLHLQCHFGLDTLTWARLGARVTGAGLRIDFLHEFPFAVWQMFPFLVEAEPRTWRLPEPLDGRLPLTFSLKATKT